MADPFIADIILFAGNFAPRNWALCQGQFLAISSNQSLFSILGTTYGGDGRTTFALPDLRSRVPIGTGQGPGLSNRQLGSKGGLENVGLTQAQMPSHTHVGDVSGLGTQLQAHTATEANSTTPGPTVVLSKFTNPSDVFLYSTLDAPLVDLGGVGVLNPAIANAGNGQGHQNRQPLIALNYIIALFGVFPSRN